MPKFSKELLESHLKTHSERSADDVAAVSTLEYFFKSTGNIICNFSKNDKWPNIDGQFELVPNPLLDRRPKQNFFVQIKGTNCPNINENGILKYQLKDLGFLSYVALQTTFDPSILFVVINTSDRKNERVFWKYISASFLSKIDFNNNSCTIEFSPQDEILNLDEAIIDFSKTLVNIADNHTFVNQLEIREYDKSEIIKIIEFRNKNICKAIANGKIENETRDDVSKKMYTELYDLCKSTLLLNGLKFNEQISIRAAWELSQLNINTKFLASFYVGLHYIGMRIPEDGQFERLLLKYYDFLWKIREYLKENFNLDVLDNLESFPKGENDEDKEYNEIIAEGIEKAKEKNAFRTTKYYIQKKTPFYIGKIRYFEITLQLADKFATKYNRINVYTKLDISSNYSIQIAFDEIEINLWDKPSRIKVVTDWKVSIFPIVLNKFANIINKKCKLSSQYGEYNSLMLFLTKTGINLLDLIDFNDNQFSEVISRIYENQNTHQYKEILNYLHKNYNNNSNSFGRNTIRFLLLRLREEMIDNVTPFSDEEKLNNPNINLKRGCYPFERNPIIYNLPNSKTNNKTVSKDVLRIVGTKISRKYLPYIQIKHLIDKSGELYFNSINFTNSENSIGNYNKLLDYWDKENGAELVVENEFVYIKEFVDNTVYILNKLIEFTKSGNDGQKQLNDSYIKKIDTTYIDDTKIKVLQNLFVNSKLLMIYGAAGTGKTTLMNHISKLMEGRSKIFLTKTHTALDNLKRRVESSGFNSEFIGIDSFLRSNRILDQDVIFIDECSTIDNRTMFELLKRINDTSLIVLAGDIFQIESIDFGNWFYYSKDIVTQKATVELNFTWRTQDTNIKSLWDEVRYKRDKITEMLVIDGPFSENIGKNIFEISDEDEVVLCLNYDGKFGLNSINSYFQDANNKSEAFHWCEWTYKIGDPILFNESKRFPKLYNNLKGKIVDIKQGNNCITFTIEVNIHLTSIDVKNGDLEIVPTNGDNTVVRFTVYENDGGTTEDEREESRIKSIVPFQLAYAVSIHKAQGLEYNSVKIVIPNSNSEKISHGIFYTAITRTKSKLKLFWSSDTMKDVIKSFNDNESEKVSLEFIKQKLKDL